MIIRQMTAIESALFESVEILQKRIAELHEENERDRNELKVEINSLNVKNSALTSDRDYWKNRFHIAAKSRRYDYWR